MLVGLTAPLTATATSVAPALERVIEDKISPSAAVAVMRAYKVPPVEDRVALGPKLELSIEISKPIGAEAEMLAVRLEEPTVKLWDWEAAPTNVEKD